jgi:hypothetical protein
LFVLDTSSLFVLPLLKLTFHALDGEPATGDATTFLLCAAAESRQRTGVREMAASRRARFDAGAGTARRREGRTG